MGRHAKHRQLVTPPAASGGLTTLDNIRICGQPYIDADLQEIALPTLAFCKPFQVISQFSESGEKRTLAEFITLGEVYPAGRLDYDSEGLMLLTDDGGLQHRISSPRFKLEKTYWVQIEGEISDGALASLRQGIALKDGLTRPAQAQRIDVPDLWPRIPPIRERKTIPTCWIELRISEGRNRQVRRMTAALGHPTLRLVRAAIGPITLGSLLPGQWREVDVRRELPAQWLRPTAAPRHSPQPRPHRHTPKPRGRSSGRRS